LVVLTCSFDLRRIRTFNLSYASGVAGSTELSKLISQSEDTNMTPNDLAFFLATHNYDATPKNGYVQVKIDSTIYKIVPNGSQPRLADLSVIN
jgi:hypothetical protein